MSILHNEGRTRIDETDPLNVKYNYDYFIRDHLGNVHLLLEICNLERLSAVLQTA